MKRVQRFVQLAVSNIVEVGFFSYPHRCGDLLGSTALHVGGWGVVWERQVDGSAGEHDGDQSGVDIIAVFPRSCASFSRTRGFGSAAHSSASGPP
jgi:hypothetical protein